MTEIVMYGCAVCGKLLDSYWNCHAHELAHVQLSAQEYSDWKTLYDQLQDLAREEPAHMLAKTESGKAAIERKLRRFEQKHHIVRENALKVG